MTTQETTQNDYSITEDFSEFFHLGRNLMKSPKEKETGCRCETRKTIVSDDGTDFICGVCKLTLARR